MTERPSAPPEEGEQGEFRSSDEGVREAPEGHLAEGDPPGVVVTEEEEEVVVLPAEGLPVSMRQRVGEFVRRVYVKSGDDLIFFMAGAISFNVIVAVVPLLLFAVGVSGIVLTNRFGDPSIYLIHLLIENLPAISGDIDLVSQVEERIRGIVDQRTGFTVVGALLLIWFSTRLVGSLRTALREVFDIAQDRGIIGGKIFDAKVVVVGGLLLLVNITISTGITAAQDYGIDFIGLQGRAVGSVERFVAGTLAFLTIWVLFVGIYRFLPARWIPWRTAIIAATFMSVFHEILKWAFGWYVTGVADYRSTYGNLVTIAVLFLWIYYEAFIFILGGEVAQVWTMRRARRVKTRSALFGTPNRNRR